MHTAFLYLHGFASGPNSTKGVALENHLAPLGVSLNRLNLRVPSFSHLRVSAMLDVVTQAMAGHERVILLGSSLGAFVAATVASRDPRVQGLFLLAPAFEIARRWQERHGKEGMVKWAATGWLETRDHTTGEMAQVDYGFFEDLLLHDPCPDPQVPTRIIHGTQDEVVHIETSRRFAKARPALRRLLEVEDGHELSASLQLIQKEAAAFLHPFALL